MARVQGDRRTAAQRSADALADICRSYLDRVDRPEIGGERPHLLVTVDLETLTRSRPGRAELPDAGAVAGAGPRPPHPVVPAALRRALVVRDRGCAFPGCGRPPGWCDAHHVVHWADGGPTALSNLVLLCRPHDRMVHRGFGVRMEGGRPCFRRPDGAPLGGRPRRDPAALLDGRAPP